MPVTKTAKRALRGSKKKESVNKVIIKSLEAAIRGAKKSKTAEKITKAVSLIDRASKKHTIHKNRAARLKSQLAKLMPKMSAAKGKTSKSKKVPAK